MANEQATGQAVAQTVDRLSAAFARELGRVLRDADRALRPILRAALRGERTAQTIAARGIALRRGLRDVLRAAGYDALVEATSTAAVQAMADQVLRGRVARAGAGLVRVTPAKLRALAELGASNLLQVGDDVAAGLWRSLAQFLFTTRPVDEIIDDLADAFTDELSSVQTLFDTQVSIYGRQVEALATAGLGADQPYLYVGPVDAKTRRWCLDRAGKVYSRDVIEAMDNGQLANAFITAGGWSCRHSWLAVESDELRALMNTGARAPGFEDRVVFADAQRQAMRERRQPRRAA